MGIRLREYYSEEELEIGNTLRKLLKDCKETLKNYCIRNIIDNVDMNIKKEYSRLIILSLEKLKLSCKIDEYKIYYVNKYIINKFSCDMYIDFVDVIYKGNIYRLEVEDA